MWQVTRQTTKSVTNGQRAKDHWNLEHLGIHGQPSKTIKVGNYTNPEGQRPIKRHKESKKRYTHKLTS